MATNRPAAAARPVNALTTCVVAAELEVVAGAEAEVLEEADEAALVPVLDAVLEALKVTP
jgi:hypothetical protein